MTKTLKKITFVGASLLVMAACTPQVPDSGAGVGFSNYAEYELERAQREAQLAGRPVPTGTAIVPPSAATPTIAPPATAAVTPDQGVTTTDLANAGIVTTPSSPDTPAAQPAAFGQNPDISDEQSFDAVSGRESIESDAERRARQAAAYQLIEATALPDRSGSAGPNIVQYALQAPNDRGERVFDRSSLSTEARFQRNCAKYQTPDAAQRDFLERGGPQRDRLGLDPDGDGFACGWDPQAFRAIASGN